VSALQGTGTGDLLDAIVAALPPEPEMVPETEDEDTGTRIAFVGRPNVGKSSLLNALLGWERAVVTDIPGTTRDAIDTEMVVDDKKLILIDTAGVRRRGRIERGIEQYSVMRSIRAIERADVVAIVVDASEGVTAQDTHLAGFAVDETKGIMVVVNKWDLIPQTSQARDAFLATVREDFKFAPYAPVLFVSALNGLHVRDVIGTAFNIVESRRNRVPTAALNELVAETIHAHSPPSDRGRSLKIYYVTQATINPPTFVFFVNDSELLHFSYKRYLENRLRQAFGFEGTAIRMVFRNRAEERMGQRPR
jgi:GTP-binding protein